MSIVGISISLTLTDIVSIMSNNSLCGGIKSLGDGVKTGAGSEGNSVVSIPGVSKTVKTISVSGVAKTVETISVSQTTIVGISISLSVGGAYQANSKKCLNHVFVLFA